MYGKNYKVVTCNGTIGDAVSDAFAEAEGLKDEMEEWKSGLEGTNFEQSDKFARISEAFDLLEEHCEAPDVPDSLADFQITWAEGRKKSVKRRGPSRAARLGNATSALSAAVDFLREIEESEEEVEEGASMVPKYSDEIKEAAGELATEIEEHKDELDGVEFPGMFG